MLPFCQVNEEGTKAGVVTRSKFRAASYGKKPTKAGFICDHPFIFVLQHRRSRMVLFMGRVVNPVEKS